MYFSTLSDLSLFHLKLSVYLFQESKLVHVVKIENQDVQLCKK